MWLLVKLNPSFLKESGNPDTPVTTAGVRQTPRWMWESLSILRDRETLFSTITEIDENGLNLYLPVFRSFFFFLERSDLPSRRNSLKEFQLGTSPPCPLHPLWELTQVRSYSATLGEMFGSCSHTQEVFWKTCKRNAVSSQVHFPEQGSHCAKILMKESEDLQEKQNQLKEI